MRLRAVATLAAWVTACSPFGGADPAGAGPVDASAGAGDAGDAGDAAIALGPFGYALHFGGASFVESKYVGMPSELTVEAWVAPDAYPAVEAYFVAEDRAFGADEIFRLGFTSDGHLFFSMSDSAKDDHGLGKSPPYALHSADALALHTWTHVAVTKKSTTFTLLVNGVPNGTPFTSDADFTRDGPAIPLRVGARTPKDSTATADSGFTGAIDEVRLWKVARTQAEFQYSNHHQLTPTDSGWPNLLSYWQFDEGAGTTTVDSKNAAPDAGVTGALVNDPMWVPSGAL